LGYFLTVLGALTSEKSDKSCAALAVNVHSEFQSNIKQTIK